MINPLNKYYFIESFIFVFKNSTPFDSNVFNCIDLDENIGVFFARNVVFKQHKPNWITPFSLISIIFFMYKKDNQFKKVRKWEA